MTVVKVLKLTVCACMHVCVSATHIRADMRDDAYVETGQCIYSSYCHLPLLAQLSLPAVVARNFILDGDSLASLSCRSPGCTTAKRLLDCEHQAENKDDIPIASFCVLLVSLTVISCAWTLLRIPQPITQESALWVCE